jgi:hypothetical protein
MAHHAVLCLIGTEERRGGGRRGEDRRGERRVEKKRGEEKTLHQNILTH